MSRIRKLAQPLPAHVNKNNAQYYDIIKDRYNTVSADLQGLNAWRYARNITGGNQEYMEAAIFQHYLTTGTLLTYEESVEQLRTLGGEGGPVQLTVEDYLLGVFDMTGELLCNCFFRRAFWLCHCRYKSFGLGIQGFRI